MKNNIKLLFSLLLLLSFSWHLSAQDKTKKVLAEKVFTVKNNATLVVNHEHGNVYCKNWDKNEISVSIIAYADTDNIEKAEKTFKRISWELKGNENEVIVRSKLTGKSSSGSSNVWVDIDIKMPKSLNLNLGHKFGKAFIETVEGVAMVTSDYGSINVNKISNPESKFKISYGDGQINSFSGNSMVVQYAKLSFDHTEDVSLRSDYSDIKGDQAGNLLLKLEGGDLNLDHVTSVSGSSSFSSLNIDHLEKSLDMETSYGSLNVDQVSRSFEQINLENNFGSANIGISAEVSYQFEANSTHGSIVYPQDVTQINYREKTTTKTTLKGIVGKKNDSNTKVFLNSNYGSINLTQN